MSKKKFVGVQFVETVRDGKKTFAFGVYQDGKVGRVPFAGLSEKHPTDKENADRGRNFAIGRAYENLGKQIEKLEWNKLQRNKKDKVSVGKKLTAKEIKEKMNTSEAVEKRKKRAAKNDKTSTKTSNPAAKTSTKVSKKS